MSVPQLSKQVRRDLASLSYPSKEWMITRRRDGVRVLDVLIVGGGQSGLAIAFGLMRERVTNIRIVDRNERGFEGPWCQFARMSALRTAKEVSGIDLGIPSLTASAWYQAKFGRRAWENLYAFPPNLWREYLDWYRDVLELPVENQIEVMLIEPAGALLLAHLRRKGRIERVHARKIVLATGIEGNGRWRTPPTLVRGLPAQRYAHSTEKINFDRLAGKRIGVLGVGASAFDNAAAALEAGATKVDLCFRRADIPRVNPLLWAHFTGILGHFGDLDDLTRWRFMRHMLEDLPQPPPQDAFWRCRKFRNFAWHANCAWRSIHDEGNVAVVETETGPFKFDFIIFATGSEIDLSARPELASIVDQIALWRDRFTPPPGEECEGLAKYPYLGSAFEFTEREPGTAPFLSRLHNFTYGAMPSLGLTGAAVLGMKYGVPRLVNGLVRDLFREDAAEHYRDLLAFAVPELRTLNSAYEWLEQLGAEALSGFELTKDFDKSSFAKPLHGEVSLEAINDESCTAPSKLIRVDRGAAASRSKPVSARSAKVYRGAK